MKKGVGFKLGDISLITEKVYTDEAIAPAGIMLTPARYRQMRRLATNGTKAEIFVRQALFMEDFTDDLPYRGELQCYYPTYEDMTTQQLRGYFTWRTRARAGVYEKTCIGFVFVYIYELINGIGGSAEQRYARLKQTYDAYSQDVSVARYLPIWLEDLAIFNGISVEFEQEPRYGYAEILYNAHTHTPHEVVTALNGLSSYSIEKSKIYAKYPLETEYTVYYAFEYISRYYLSIGSESFFMRLLGSSYEAPYQMFAGAVYLPREHEDCTVQINLFKKYTCRDGRWYITRLLEYHSGGRRIAELLKGIDNLLRKKYGVSPILKNASLNAVRQKLAERAYADAVKHIQAQKREEAAKRVVIDLSALEDIRRDADAVAMRLTVEEEKAELIVPREMQEQNAEESRDEEYNAYMCNDAYIENEQDIIEKNDESGEKTEAELLDEHEMEYLRLMLLSKDARAYLRSRGMMQGVVAESINQKLYNIFGDTVLDAEGNIIEDYLEELKGIVRI